MALTLSEKEQATLVSVQQTLLSPDNLIDRGRLGRIFADIRGLIGSVRGFAVFATADDFIYLSDGVGPEIEAYFGASLQGFDKAGNFILADKDLEEINRRRRNLGAGVHHEGALQMREKIEASEYFKTAFKPAGMHHVIGMTTPMPVGEAVFAFGFEGADDPGFSGGRSEAILRLILPAFVAGFAALAGEAPPAPGSGTDWESLAARAVEKGLSPRQAEVAVLMARGLSSPEIADDLGIRPDTARRHAEAVLRRLDVRSRAAVLPALSET